MQALVLLNDPQFVEAARKIGERILTEGGPDLESRIRYACRLLTSRTPSDSERRILERLYREQRALFERDASAAASLLKVGQSSRDPSLNPVDLAASAVLADALLNFDDTVIQR
jgi:hypothetical protein